MPRYAHLIIALVAGGTTVASLGALGVGCGDDTATPAPEDGSVDSTTADGPSAEGTMGDTGNAHGDAAPETSNDGGAPGNEDAEGGVVVAPPSPLGFSTLVSTAWCRSLERCCGLADAGTFNMQQCIALVGDYNLSNDLSGVTGTAADSGVIRYNQAEGNKCFQDIQSLACGLLPSASLLTIRAECFAAIQGTIPVGTTGCVTSLECGPQGFCNVPSDGGVTTCLPLAGAGGPCTSNDQCSYHASGQPALYCDIRFADGGSHVCLAQGGLDASCGVTYPDYDQECTTDLCVAPGVCGSNNVFSDPGVAGGTCDRLTIKDAGGGG